MKRYLCGLLGLVVGLVAATNAFAQPAISLEVVSTSGDPGDKGVVLRIKATAVDPISGIQFTLRGFSDNLTPKSVRAGALISDSSLAVYSSIYPGGDSLKVILVSFKGDSLSPGTGVLMEVLFDVASNASVGTEIPITFNEVIVVSDPSRNSVDGVHSDGSVTIVETPSSTLSFASDPIVLGQNGNLYINLDNSGLNDSPRTVNEVQITVAADGPELINLLGVNTVGRATGFEATFEPGEGGIQITLTRPDGGALPNGDGPIVAVSLNGTAIGSGSVSFESVVLLDLDGVALPNGPNTGTTVSVISPVASENDEATTDEDTPVDVFVLANDETTSPLHVFSVSDPKYGSATVSEDSSYITYTPDENFNGEDSLAYVVRDGNGGLDTASVAITVGAVNDAPKAGDDEVSTNEDVPIIIAVTENDFDSDGHAITVRSATNGTKGTTEIQPDSASVKYTPNPNAFGNDSFDYTIRDTHGGLDTATVFVAITQINDPPIFVTLDLPPATEGVGYTALVQATDPEHDQITYALDEDAPDWLSIHAITGELSGTPGSEDTGDEISVIVLAANPDDEGDSHEYFISVGQDDTDPVFTQIPQAQGITNDKATIVWATNEPATGSVGYGKETGQEPVSAVLILSSQARIDTIKTGLSKFGIAQLSDLTGSTPYTAQVRISDARGNTTTSSLVRFRTLASPDLLPPFFTSLPTVTNRTDKSLTFSWVSNEAAKGIITVSRINNIPLEQDIIDSTAAFVTAGSITLNDLEASATYTAAIALRDPSGNGAGGSEQDNNPQTVTGATRATPDLVAPARISGPIASGVTDSRASIAYETNEPATTLIQYGLNESFSSTFKDTLNFVTNHHTPLTGLTAATTYFYRVSATDRSGNQMAFSSVNRFRTRNTPDTTPPAFTKGPSVLSTTDNSAALEWVTNEPASYRLKTVESGSADTTVATAGDLIPLRSVTLNSLKANTLYFYFLTATDGSDNSGQERSGEFKTKTTPDTTPPALIGFVNVVSRDFNRFTVAWKTNEASDSQGEVSISRTGQTLSDPTTVNRQALTADHTAVFAGLEAETRYFFKVRSRDAAGNEFVSIVDSLRTRATPDETPPAISGIIANAELNQALILWNTNSELSDSRVVYGTDSTSVAQGNLNVATVVENAEAVRDHQVTLAGLNEGTRYFYRVQSTDASGNRSVLQPSRPKVITTKAAGDVLAPKITEVDDDPSITGATITWRTDEPSNSVVLFDDLSATLPSVPANNKEESQLVIFHVVNLTGLSPNTPYRFRVQSTDQAGNKATSPSAGAPKTFKTDTNVQDTQAPLITEGPFIGYSSDISAIIKWITDEEADERVYFRVAGAEDDYDQRSGVSDLRTEHQVTVDGLVRGTAYEFVIASKDGSNNEVTDPKGAFIIRNKVAGGFTITNTSQAPIGRFTTRQSPDTQAPTILNGPIITSSNATAVTIQWVTDEMSTSAVNFGTGGATDQQTENGSLVTSHSLSVTNLTPSTVYSFIVGSTDPNNNGPTTSPLSVTQTLSQPDITPPTISAVSQTSVFVNASDGSSATITWTTNEAASSTVEFGTTASLGETKTVSGNSLTHSVTLTRLTPAATYHYRVVSTDASGNGPTIGSTISFAAENLVDTDSPTFSDFSSSGTTHEKITVTWTTNENATSILVAIAGTDTVTLIDGVRTISHSMSITDTVFARPSTTYKVIIEGQDASNNLGISSSQNVTTSAGPDVTPPSAPGTFTAAAGNAQIQLVWSAVSASDLAGYNVYKGSTQIASNLTGTTFNATGLTNGALVTFTVEAADNTGNKSTANPTASATPSAGQAPSAPLSANTFIGGSPADTVSLKPILIVGNATPVSGRSTPAYTFAVYSDTGLTNLVASIAGVVQGTATNPTHWQVSNASFLNGIVLVEGTRYHWRARASDNVTDGDWTARRTFITSSAKPTAIQLASMVAESDRGMVVVTWKTFSSAGLTGFQIYRSKNAAGPFESVSDRLISLSVDGEYRFQDADVQVNATYYYQIEAVNQGEASQRFGPISVKVSPPNTFTLGQNFPNPFNPTTTIRYELPLSGEVRLVVFNILGQEVVTLVDAQQSAGFHTVTWNGVNQARQHIASGVYFYRITVKDGDKIGYANAKKMLLLK